PAGAGARLVGGAYTRGLFFFPPSAAPTFGPSRYRQSRRTLDAFPGPTLTLSCHTPPGPAPRGHPGTGRPGPTRLGCPRRSGHTHGVSALRVARADRDPAEHTRRAAEHVYADGPRGWRHILLCGRRVRC